MEDLVRASNLTGAMQDIKTLKEQLHTAQTDLAHWKILVGGEIVSAGDGFQLKINVSKPDGRGFIKTILHEDILYYVEDPEALISQIVEDVHNQLFKDTIRNELSAIVTRGLRNAKFTIERAR
jgi:hypothetical protein